MARQYEYIIVGAGLAGGAAIEGIREHDQKGSILLIGAEPDLPYHRPPLTKQLWKGKSKLPQIYIHDSDFYRHQEVDLELGTRIIHLDIRRRVLTDNQNRQFIYKKLLLATGGEPARLDIPGGDLPEIFYFRTLNDYLRLYSRASEHRTVLVIGGGFIGSEIAAALCMNHLDVTMLIRGAHVGDKVFPESLGRAISAMYAAHGVQLITGDQPELIERKGNRLVVRTQTGRQIQSDIVVAGIGIEPSLAMAASAGLQTNNGIEVNEYLQTSSPDVYAAGDNASFPQIVLGRSRVEHWDNALHQGRCAGRNMAGAREVYNYMPFFFSDLFDFGYEAVGQVDSRLETVCDWQEENHTGVIYYLKDGYLKGAMMCNLFEKVDEARELISRQQRVDAHDLHGAIPFEEAEPIGIA